MRSLLCFCKVRQIRMNFFFNQPAKIDGSGNNLEFEHRNVVLGFHVEVVFRERTEEPSDSLPEPKRCTTKDLVCLWTRRILSG